MSERVAGREALEVSGMRAGWWPAAGRSARERARVFSALTCAWSAGESGAMGRERGSGRGISAGPRESNVLHETINHHNKKTAAQFPAHFRLHPRVLGRKTPSMHTRLLGNNAYIPCPSSF